MDPSKRISAAKSKLILRHPFIGSIALGLPVELTEDDTVVPTAAVDGTCMIFNTKYMQGLSDDELLFLVAHECMHPMLQHNYRRKNRDKRTWNQAADYVINQLLTDEKIGVMPSNGLLNKTLYDAGNGSAEAIYTIIKQDKDDGKDPDQDPLDDCRDAQGDDDSGTHKSQSQMAQEEADWKIRVAQAAQAAKTQGKLSAGMARLVQETLAPSVNWREVLHRFVRKTKETRTFARLDRRFMTQGLYMPSRSGEKLGTIVVAVDCSGSVSQEDLKDFVTEVKNIYEDLTPEQLVSISFDSAVNTCEVFQKEDGYTPSFKGGGGTAFSPVFKKIQEENLEPDVCVVLTDLCSNDFGPCPDYPVLWVDSYGGYKAPWGETVVMKKG